MEESKAYITVQNGVAVSIEYQSDQVPQNAGKMKFDNVDTIPKLFDKARATLRKARAISVPAFSASVAYDQEFGYPRNIDYGLTSFLGYAGDYFYQASFLRPLPYPQPTK